jgi:hypothetical protein
MPRSPARAFATAAGRRCRGARGGRLPPVHRALSVRGVVATLSGMARGIVTADELEGMTPAEQDAHFEASIVRDLSTVSPVVLARVRERVE